MEFVDFFENYKPTDVLTDPLPLKVLSHPIPRSDLFGQAAYWAFEYLNQKRCPSMLLSTLLRIIGKEIEESDLSAVCYNTVGCEDNVDAADRLSYKPLQLMQKVTTKADEICCAYKENNGRVIEDFNTIGRQSYESDSIVSHGSSEFSMKNTRRSLEDRAIVLPGLDRLFKKDHPKMDYFAVMDGHSGIEAASYAVTHLHHHLVQSSSFPHDLEQAFIDAFHATDESFTKNSSATCRSGSTAVTALLTRNELTVAWAGDSQAILVREHGIVNLVRPHKPEREDEMKRIEDMGGAVIQTGGIWRVNGILGVARAIGDKSITEVISTPDVKTVILNGTEEFLILACDGFWDVIPPVDAAALVRKYLEDDRDTDGFSKALAYEAKHQRSTDNITVITVLLRSVESLKGKYRKMEKNINGEAFESEQHIDSVQVIGEVKTDRIVEVEVEKYQLDDAVQIADGELRKEQLSEPAQIIGEAINTNHIAEVKMENDQLNDPVQTVGEVKTEVLNRSTSPVPNNMLSPDISPIPSVPPKLQKKPLTPRMKPFNLPPGNTSSPITKPRPTARLSASPATPSTSKPSNAVNVKSSERKVPVAGKPMNIPTRPATAVAAKKPGAGGPNVVQSAVKSPATKTDIKSNLKPASTKPTSNGTTSGGTVGALRTIGGPKPAPTRMASRPTTAPAVVMTKAAAPPRVNGGVGTTRTVGPKAPASAPAKPKPPAGTTVSKPPSAPASGKSAARKPIGVASTSAKSTKLTTNTAKTTSITGTERAPQLVKIKPIVDAIPKAKVPAPSRKIGPSASSTPAVVTAKPTVGATNSKTKVATKSVPKKAESAVPAKNQSKRVKSDKPVGKKDGNDKSLEVQNPEANVVPVTNGLDVSPLVREMKNLEINHDEADPKNSVANPIIPESTHNEVIETMFQKVENIGPSVHVESVEVSEAAQSDLFTDNSEKLINFDTVPMAEDDLLEKEENSENLLELDTKDFEYSEPTQWTASSSSLNPFATTFSPAFTDPTFFATEEALIGLDAGNYGGAKCEVVDDYEVDVDISSDASPDCTVLMKPQTSFNTNGINVDEHCAEEDKFVAENDLPRTSGTDLLKSSLTVDDDAPTATYNIVANFDFCDDSFKSAVDNSAVLHPNSPWDIRQDHFDKPEHAGFAATNGSAVDVSSSEGVIPVSPTEHGQSQNEDN